jgi:ankyrin repeat protein
MSLPSQYTRTPLIMAVEEENAECIAALIARGADIESADNVSKTRGVLFSSHVF